MTNTRCKHDDDDDDCDDIYFDDRDGDDITYDYDDYDNGATSLHQVTYINQQYPQKF